jgi:hypothetical protein
MCSNVLFKKVHLLVIGFAPVQYQRNAAVVGHDGHLYQLKGILLHNLIGETEVPILLMA